MGSLTGDPDEQPVRQVYVGAFFMDTHQVAVGQYARFLEATHHDSPPEWTLMNKQTTRIAPSPMWIGGTRTPIANGPASASRQRRSGRRRRGGRMAGPIHGGMSLRRGFTRPRERGLEQPLGHYRRWEHLKKARVPMASMTWPGMSGSGSAIGMTRTITRARRRIRQDRERAIPKWSVAAPGAAVRRTCAPRDREVHVPSFRGFGTGFRCAKNP